MNNFYDPEFKKFCLQQYEAIRQRRNAFKGKPDQYDLVDIALDRMFSDFYKKIIK